MKLLLSVMDPPRFGKMKEQICSIFLVHIPLANEKKLSIRIMPLKSSYSLPQWDPNGWLNMILENPMLLSR